MLNPTSDIATAANDGVCWSGHQPTTRAAMKSILERAAFGDSEFSVAERALFMACEFWAAANNGVLARHLDPNAWEHLYLARTVFFSIGARDISQAIDTACTDLAGLTDKAARRRYIAALEHYLLTSEDPVDTLLARFAAQVTGVGRKRPRVARMACYS